MARQNLRKTIGRLKQALDEAEPNLAEAVLAITRESIALRGAHTTADVLTFRAHLAAVRSHPHPALAHCPTCHMRLQAAVALTQRGEFLAGLTLPDAPPFDEWLLIQRENLYQQQLAALHQLAQTYEAQGAWEPALQCAHAQIALEPWREEAHRQAMRLLASHGRRAEAIAQYQTCRQILQDELGVEPTAETEALLAQIRAGGLERETAALSPTAERLHHFPTLFEPLIGREGETAQIAAQLAEPTCRLLTITGQGAWAKRAWPRPWGKPLPPNPFLRMASISSRWKGWRRPNDWCWPLGKGWAWSCKASRRANNSWPPICATNRFCWCWIISSSWWPKARPSCPICSPPPIL
ncbi:MAG: hypothetical protein IPL28_11465 [Chloroflexi bacterium]|nr:hypothetical protein [Chloroflexota bacterium]